MTTIKDYPELPVQRILAAYDDVGNRPLPSWVDVEGMLYIVQEAEFFGPMLYRYCYDHFAMAQQVANKLSLHVLPSDFHKFMMNYWPMHGRSGTIRRCPDPWSVNETWSSYYLAMDAS